MIPNIKHDVYEMYYLGIRTMDDSNSIFLTCGQIYQISIPCFCYL